MTFYGRSQTRVRKYVCQAAVIFVLTKTRFAGIEKIFSTGTENQKKDIMNRKTIVYSINVEDLQTVAKQELSRELSSGELALVADKVGDYIDWHGAVAAAIEDRLQEVAT